MSTTRCDFLVRSAAAAGALGFGFVPRIALGDEAEPSRTRAAKPLNILILGGTGFTGPEQVNYALSRGHHVTLFNRNKTRPDMFKGKVDQLIGDLRRLIRQYGRSADTVFPVGPWAKGGNYGGDVNIPVPQAEQNNPNVSANTCIDRNA